MNKLYFCVRICSDMIYYHSKGDFSFLFSLNFFIALLVLIKGAEARYDLFQPPLTIPSSSSLLP